jgi:hypothetical protein
MDSGDLAAVVVGIPDTGIGVEKEVNEKGVVGFHSTNALGKIKSLVSKSQGQTFV